MDFITQLSKTTSGFDSIYVVMDRLSKYVRLIPTVTTVTAPSVARLFVDNIYRSTEQSSFFLNHGRHPSVPPWRCRFPVQEFVDHVTSLTKLARDNTFFRAQQKQASQADLHRRDVIFVVGWFVSLSRLLTGPLSKLDKRTKGRKRSSRVEYLVKWLGYPEYDAIWQTVVDLEGAPRRFRNMRLGS